MLLWYLISFVFKHSNSRFKFLILSPPFLEINISKKIYFRSFLDVHIYFPIFVHSYSIINNMKSNDEEIEIELNKDRLSGKMSEEVRVELKEKKVIRTRFIK